MSDDYLQQRLRQKLFGKQPEEKKIYHIPKKSAKKVILERIAKESGQDGLMDKWFEERRKEMKGKCAICGGKTEKDNDETYRRSIHHLLDKRKSMFPSVALHKDNWLEVCFWSNSCHSNLHNGTITWELLFDSKEKDIIMDKIKKIYPFIAPNELKNLPDIIVKEIHQTT